MAEKKETLFDVFSPVSAEEWKAKITADLKGADFDKKLVWRTNEGFSVQPFYRKEDIEGLATIGSLPGEFPYVRGTRDNNDWLIRQEVQGSTDEELNAHARHILDRGAESLGFTFHHGKNDADLSVVLKDIDLKKVEINITCCPGKAVAVAEQLVKIVKAAGAENDFRGSIGYNPFRRLLKHGLPFPKDAAQEGKALYEVVKEIKGLRCFAVDSFMFNNAGAFITQELGYALAWGAEWLTLLTDRGLSVDEAASRVKFNMGISSNYFMEIAKFRAARMLWAQIVELYKPASADACKMAVHAVTSRFNQTVYDAHVNLLRSQTECMSAALAGVDSITVTPFDAPYRTPDDFSERIARNQQFLLKEESHLDKVVDPAGGSYYVETLTVAIAKEAWKLFLEVEDKGGFLAAVNDGEVQRAVRATSDKRHTDVARRKEILLGTNQYPNINEMAASKIEATGCSCGCHNHDDDNADAALPTARAASDFEALRLATEAASNRPKVFMLTIGNLAMRLARAQFSTNFFGCAGYEIIDNLGFETVQQGVDEALAKGADVIVLCSSDDEYAELAPEAYRYLDGRAEFVVAGAPACTDDLKAIGIENFVNVRSNVLDTLRAFNERLLK